MSKFGEFNRCENCKEYHYSSEDCKPIYYVHDEEDMGENEWKEVRAVDHEDAAIEYAQHYNDEGSLMDTEIEIIVCDEDGDKKRFCISAEPDIHYSANEI